MALYFGETWQEFGEDADRRYEFALAEEFAVLTALAVYDEAIKVRKLWKMSQATYDFLTGALPIDVLPVIRRPNHRSGDLLWSDIMRRVQFSYDVADEFLADYRVGDTICKWTRWDDGRKAVSKPVPRHQRYSMPAGNMGDHVVASGGGFGPPPANSYAPAGQVYGDSARGAASQIQTGPSVS